MEDAAVSEIAPVKIPNTTILGEMEPLEHYVPPCILALAQQDDQKAIPMIAKSRALAGEVELAARRVPTTHKLVPADARYLEFLPSETVHLVVTSPPYFVYWSPAAASSLSLGMYASRGGHLGDML
jgi:hypothetical protein